MSNIIDTINPPKKSNEWRDFFRFLLLSIISCAFLGWLYHLILSIDCLSKVLKLLLCFLTALIGSALLGFCIAIITQKNLIRNTLSKLKINNIHPIPTAWDYCFFMEEGTYLIVTLTDGTEIRGLFSNKSLASSDIDNHDLFIEQAYDSNWKAIDYNHGVYIPKEQINYIEFLKGDDHE